MVDFSVLGRGSAEGDVWRAVVEDSPRRCGEYSIIHDGAGWQYRHKAHCADTERGGRSV